MGFDWRDFKERNGGEEGARAAFEKACESLIRRTNSNLTAQAVRANPGDEGIDIYVGDLDRDEIDVYQCKFHLEKLGPSQQRQIRESFLKAVNSPKYRLKKWVLCLPKVLDFKENQWWSKFRRRNRESFKIAIELMNGDELLLGGRKYGLITAWFKVNRDDELEIRREVAQEVSDRLRQHWKQVQIKLRTKFFCENCFGTLDEPTGSYIQTTLIRQTAEKSREFRLTNEETKYALWGEQDVGQQARMRPLLITADSGIGKTTLLQKCAMDLANTSGHKIPVLLTDLSRYLKGGTRDSFLKQVALREFTWIEDKILRSDWLEQMSAKGNIVFMLDALDQTDSHWKHLDDVVTEMPECHFVLTARPEAKTSRNEAFGTVDWDEVHLRPFDVSEVDVYLGKNATVLPGYRENLELFRIPLIASLAKEFLDGLPEDIEPWSKVDGLENRYDLYWRFLCGDGGLVERGLATLIKREPSSKKVFRRKSDAIRRIAAMAFWQTSHKNYFETSVDGELYDLWIEEFQQNAPSEIHEDDLHAAIAQINILTCESVIEVSEFCLTWRHRSFLEFFAGIHLATLEFPEIVDLIDGVFIGDESGELEAQWRWIIRFGICHANRVESGRDLAVACLAAGQTHVPLISVDKDHLNLDTDVVNLARWLDEWNWVAYAYDIESHTRGPTPAEAIRSGRRVAERFSELMNVDVTDFFGRLLSPNRRDIHLLSSTRELLTNKSFLQTTEKADQEWIARQVYHRGLDCRNKPIDEFLQEERFVRFKEHDLWMSDFPITNAVVEGFFPRYRRFRNEYSSADDQPAIYLSPASGDEICDWLSTYDKDWWYRLPTEEEWNHYASWGAETNYWWGNEVRRDICWIGQDRCRSRTESIEAYELADVWHPSKTLDCKYGLLDVLGNVWEICCGFNVYPSGLSAPLFSCRGKGGSYDSSYGSCQLRARESFGPNQRPGTIGYRILRQRKVDS